MKKFIALFACAFVAFTFEGCAVRSFETYNDYDYEEEEEPVVKPQPKPKAKQKAPVKQTAQVKQKTPAKLKQNVAAPAKKKVDYEIVTDNLYPIPKALDVNNDFTVVSLTPVAYTSQDHCNEVYFFSAIVTPTSGYHGLVDISMSESKVEGGYSCKYFGSAVVYQVKPNPFVKETIKYEDVVRKFVPD
jgi:hypothetical protein